MPGRGRAPAAVYNFALVFNLAFTDVDPIEWNIPVARFMNPLRDDLPDVDIDFADRQHIMDLIQCTPARQNAEGRKHNSGVYVTPIPVDAPTTQMDFIVCFSDPHHILRGGGFCLENV